jgi:exopolyphosphatase / guanosine-5'-triphosphate,3'-diphosphate pyrophosphatase
MPTFAAVDIGANSVRLKIARLVRQRLKVIHEDREVTRLGESVFRTGALDPHTMEHTIKVLRRFHRAGQGHGVDFVRVVATSPLRDSRNSRAFIDWVRAVTGWRVEVISGLEEGRLIHFGVISGTRIGVSRLLLIDLGGGSCELTLSVDGQIRSMFSLSVGAVRLTQEFLHHDPPRKAELKQMQEFIVEELSRIERRIAAAHVQLAIATSGTAAALASVVAARRRGASNRHPGIVSRRAVHTLAAELQSYPLEQRIALPGIGPRRAEIIIAGATVFAELMNHGVSGFRYSPLGLRDGLLAQMAADYGHGAHARRQIESERWNALLAAGKHYGADLRFATRVRNLAVQLFAGLKKVHRLPPDYQDWLAAAAMLHEVGFYLNRTGRHRHSYYIISNSEIFGYTAQQRRLIAAIARYMGKSRPAPSDRALKPLSVADRELVPKAVVLLRLARALDHGRRDAVSGVRVQIEGERVILRLQTKRSGADLELWALEKERSYFRNVFGRELLAVAAEKT